MRGREKSSTCSLIPEMPTVAGTGPGRSQEPRVSSKSSCGGQGPGTQVLESSLSACRVHVGRQLDGRQAKDLNLGMLAWDAGVPKWHL